MPQYHATYINRAGQILRTAPMPLSEILDAGWAWNQPSSGKFLVAIDIAA